MSPRETAFGGVLIDGDGRILLREPSGHYDGYVWTFAKGRPSAGESPEETALRETLEETGVVAEIVAAIPGVFAGGTTDNVYFLMRPVGDRREPIGETRGMHWAETPQEARELISQTTNETGRKRDLAVLEAALAVYSSGT